MRKPGFITLRMKRSGAHTCTRRHSNYYRSGLPPAIMNFSQVIYYLIKPNRNKIGKLHFHYTGDSFERETNRNAYYGTFAKGRIAHPMIAKFGCEPFRYFECTPIFGNILTHQYQFRISFHALPECFADGIQHSFYRHFRISGVGC